MFKIDFLWFHSVKPTLKKVSKYENKFAKLQKKAAEFNFRNQLKVVKKKEFTLEEEDKEVQYSIISWLSWLFMLFIQLVFISYLGEKSEKDFHVFIFTRIGMTYIGAFSKNIL